MKTKLIILFAFLVLGVRHADAVAMGIFTPSSNTTQADSVQITINSSASNLTSQLIFTMTSGYYYNTSVHADTIQFSSVSGTTSFYLNPVTLISATRTITAVGSTTFIQDGTYTVSGRFSSGGSWTNMLSPKTNVTIDTKTLPPALLLPVDSSTVGNSFVIQDSIPEACSNHTKIITLTGANTYTLTLTNSLKDSFALDVINPLSSSSVYSMTNGPSIANGTYTMTLSYQDSYNHTAAASVGQVITINATSPTPFMTRPLSSSTIGGQMTFDFTIPDRYKSGTLYIVFDDSGTTDTVVFKNTLSVGTNILTLNAGNLLSSPYVQSATSNSLNEGIYNITLSYQDSAGYFPASTMATNVTLDETTQPPVLLAPINAIVGGSIPLQIVFELPELPASNTLTALFNNGSGTCEIGFNVSSGTDTIVLNRLNLVASPGVSSSTCGSSLADGTYHVAIQYQDYLGNPIATSDTGVFILDETTLTPSITLPASSSTIGDEMTFHITIPEKYMPGTLQMIFDSSGTKDTVLLSNTIPVGADTLVLDAGNLTGSSLVQTATKNFLSDGIYNITLSYQDSLGNPVARTTVSNVTLEKETQAPILISPVNGTIGGSIPLQLSFTLPETPYVNSVSAIFDNGTISNTIILNTGTSGTTTINLNPANLYSSLSVVSATHDSLPDGTYHVVIQYEDAFGNPVATSDTGVFVLDEITLAPTLILPGAGSTNSAMVPVSFSLLENALDSTAHVVFSGSNTVTINLHTNGTGLQSYTLNANNLSATPGYITATQNTIPDGIYMMYVSYQDTLANLSATTTDSSVAVDKTTLAPVLTLPADSSTVEQNITVNFTLPETPSHAQLVFSTTGFSDTLVLANATKGTNSFTLNSKHLLNPSYVVSENSDTLPDGIYTVTLSYNDSLDNPAASASSSNVTLDDITEMPVITLPITSGMLSGQMTFHLTIPESYAPNSLKLVFDSAGTINTIALANTLRVGADTLVLNASNLNSSSFVQTATKTILNDGIYTITLSYQDIHSNPAASATVTNITLQKETLAPVLTAPASSSTVGPLIAFNYTLPERPLSGSVTLTFTGVGTSTTIVLSDVPAGTHSLTLNAKKPALSSGVFEVTGDSLKDGIYSVALSYIDSLENPAASVTNTNITLDETTQTPILLSPLSATVGGGNPIQLSFSLPETPSASSVKIVFNSGSNPCTVTLNTSTADTTTLYFNPHHLSATPAVTLSTYDSLPDGTYQVTVQYQDALGNPVATSNTGTLVLDETTQAPVIIAPASSSTVPDQMTFRFTIPESYLPNSLQMIFDIAGAKDTVVLANTLMVGTDTFVLNASNLNASSLVQSATTSNLNDGIYTITISYQDALGNSAASTTVTNVKIQKETATPVLTSPASSSVSGRYITVNYTLPEKPMTGTLTLNFNGSGSSSAMLLNDVPAGTHILTLNAKNLSSSVGISQAIGDSLQDGIYSVTLTYADSVGNPAASITNSNVILDLTTQAPSLILPGSGSTNNMTFDISFSIPENASNNTATLSLAGTDTLTIGLHTIGTGLQTFTINGSDLPSTQGILSYSQAAIPDGVYTLTLSYQDTLGNPAASASQIDISISGGVYTGINEKTNNSLVSIYPNPSNGTFTIHTATEGTYSIVNETGQTIQIIHLNAANNYTLNAETLSRGIYFIVGFNNGEVMRQKVVVVK